MIEKIAIDLVDQMTETKLIHKDMAERYIYVAICWMEKFITIGTIILISIAVQKFLPTLFFLIFFLGLRKRTGGYHLDKFNQCYLASILSYLAIFGHKYKFGELSSMVIRNVTACNVRDWNNRYS